VLAELAALIRIWPDASVRSMSIPPLVPAFEAVAVVAATF
jgi:hypothetical protein